MIYRKVVEPSRERPLLIGFSGKERAGKTTAAEYLCDKYAGYKLAFADALKRSLYDLNAIRGPELGEFLEFCKERGHTFDFHGFPKSSYYNPSPADKTEWMNKNKTLFGNVMQVYGDFKRDKDPEIFIRRTMQDIERLIDSDKFVILVDDIRFNNEGDALESIGFNVVRVQASDSVRTARGSCRDPQHPSEVQLDSRFHTYAVFNNLEKHDLYRQLDQVVEQILNRE